MNKLLIICGLGFLGVTTTSQEVNEAVIPTENVVFNVSLSNHEEFLNIDSETISTVFIHKSYAPENLDIRTIEFEKFDEEYELGFDTSEYLPENFDPYRNYFDLRSIEFIIEDKSEDLDLVSAVYLPANFDPYAAPENFMDVSYIEDDKVELGFDTHEYLPESFDPYNE